MLKALNSSSSMNPSSLSHDQITERARKIWEDYGRPGGRDEEIWLEAERQLSASGASTPKVGARAIDTPTAPILSEKPAKPAMPTKPAEPTKMASPATFADRVTADAAAESAKENLISPPIPVQDAVKAALPAKDKMAAKPELKKPATKKPVK
jgi:hypothetical protein